MQPGAREDALWFALGANRTNGKNMTAADKRHAIVMALQTWPERSQVQIAEQIGCTREWVGQVRRSMEVTSTVPVPARVTGKDGKSYTAGPMIDSRCISV
ncbi:MAG: hypothetical protein AB7Q29_11640 [Vicinamibacterales bacterium]